MEITCDIPAVLVADTQSEISLQEKAFGYKVKHILPGINSEMNIFVLEGPAGTRMAVVESPVVDENRSCRYINVHGIEEAKELFVNAGFKVVNDDELPHAKVLCLYKGDETYLILEHKK